MSWTWRKGLLISTVVVVFAGWFWFAVSPTHWLRRVDIGTVTVDGKQAQADVYFGNPTSSEAEAIALVHLKDGGDYFLDFGSEKVRQGKASDYLRLIRGAWCIRPMQSGSFRDPLPFRNINEFRISTESGHVVSIQF